MFHSDFRETRGRRALEVFFEIFARGPLSKDGRDELSRTTWTFLGAGLCSRPLKGGTEARPYTKSWR